MSDRGFIRAVLIRGVSRRAVPALAMPVLAGALLLGSPGASRAAPLELLPPAVGTAEIHQGAGPSGLALRGFDPVSYHLPGGPLPGSADREVLWSGVAWRFASEANRQAFLGDPEAFAPRLGGRDAAAAARGRAADADPGLFVVRDGRLYLFRTPEGRAAFAADPALAEAAEAGWREIEGTLVRE
jgi:hypothetical protein